MKLFAVGLNHRTTPVELREQLAISAGEYSCRACRLRVAGGLQELVLLSTCNRVEVYGIASRVRADPRRCFQLSCPLKTDLSQSLYVHFQSDAVKHLFEVAAGLDSMVLGETEISGQVKAAYEQARAAGLTGRVLNQIFQRALQTAKEIRTSTGIGRGATSVASVAGEVAEKIFGPTLPAQTILIIGAGRMGEACIRHFFKKGSRSVLVTNRSFERAQALAGDFGGHAVPFDDHLAAVVAADIVIVSTACPSALLTRENLEGLRSARRGRPLFLVDISVPRNIDPAVDLMDDVYLYNIDDLQGIAQQNFALRQQQLGTCAEIIERRVKAVWARLSSPSSASRAGVRFAHGPQSAETPALLFRRPVLLPAVAAPAAS